MDFSLTGRQLPGKRLVGLSRAVRIFSGEVPCNSGVYGENRGCSERTQGRLASQVKEYNAYVFVLFLTVVFGVAAAAGRDAGTLSSLLAAATIGVGGILASPLVPRSWPVLGTLFGALVGYLVPTHDLAHNNWFEDWHTCFLNTIHLAVAGALAGFTIDIWLRPLQLLAMRQFSLSTLLWLVTAAAVVCASARMYWEILTTHL